MKYDNITKTKEREEFTMKKRFLSVLCNYDGAMGWTGVYSFL